MRGKITAGKYFWALLTNINHTPAGNNMQKLMLGSLLISATIISGCNSDSNDTNTPNTDNDNTNDTYTSLVLDAKNAYVYLDLDSAESHQYSEREAIENNAWDIAFYGTNVMLNTHVTGYFSGNNSEFYVEGVAAESAFTAATADTELADFTDISNIPDGAEFFADEFSFAATTDGFYTYNSTTHQISANAEQFYVVNNDGIYSKFNITALNTSGYVMSSATLNISNSSDASAAFAEGSDLTLNFADCSGNIYVDLNTKSITSADDWDIYFPCTTVGANTGSDFEFKASMDAKLTASEDASAVAAQVKNRLFNEKAKWYFYRTTDHTIWSQFGVYLLNTGNDTHKLQITSYYKPEDNTSRFYNLRYKAL